MKRFGMLASLGLAVVLGVHEQSEATLTINVVDAGAGNTQWIFSSTPGNPTLGADSFSTSTLGTGNFFTDLDNSPYTTIALQTEFAAIGGAATITIGAQSTSLNRIMIDLDGVDTDDLGIAGIAALPFSAGDEVSWTGSLLMPIPFSSLIPGTYGPALGQAGANGNPNNVLPRDFRLIIGSAIPEPATASLALMGLAGFAMRRRRHA